MRRPFVALGAEYEQTAGGQRLRLHRFDLRLDFDARGALGFGRRIIAKPAMLGAPFGQSHVEIAAELNVRTAAGHVGGDGDRAGHAGVGDDEGFLLVIARVEHAVRQADDGLAVVFPTVGLEQFGKLLRLLDRHRADQDRLAAAMAVLDLGDDRTVLFRRRTINLVVVVPTHDRSVGRDLGDIHLVDVEEFLRLGGGGAGHARELVIQAEVVLDGDRRQRLVLGLDGGAFLGLDGLVEALRQPPSMHHAAGELVDQHHLAVADDVVLVPLVEDVGAQRLIDVMDDGDVGRVIQAGRSVGEVPGRLQRFLDRLGTVLGEQRLLLLLVVLEGVGILDHLLNDQIDRPVEIRAVLGRTGNDQRRTRLVDQDRVDFVDDREMVTALDHLTGVVDEIVAQIVEAELVVGAVGDVRGVGALALALGQAVDDHAHLEAEEAIDTAHPLGVARGEVVVDGDQVHALAGERVQIDRQGGDQGLAFAGAHLGDAALMQHHPADHLHVVVPLTKRAPGRFTHHGEGFVHQIIETFAGGETRLEGAGSGAQIIVGQGRDLRLQRIDLGHAGHHRLDLAVVGRAENLLEC